MANFQMPRFTGKKTASSAANPRTPVARRKRTTLFKLETLERRELLTTNLALGYVGAAASQPEGNSGATPYVYTITRTDDGNAGTGTVANQTTSVSYSVAPSGANPANSQDFVGNSFPTNVSVTFGLGQTVQSITVNVQGDTVLEPDETFTVSLSSQNPSSTTLSTPSVTSTIQNDDSTILNLAAFDANKLEGNGGSTPFFFTVTRTGDDLSGNITVGYAVTGTGANPANPQDFTGGVFPSGNISFTPGQSVQTIVVPVNGDTIQENDETFLVSITGTIPTSAPSPTLASGLVTLGTSTANGTIINDDTTTLAISATNANLFEGNSGTTPFTFTVTRGGDTSGTTTVNYNVAGTGANPADANDFGGVLPSGSVTFGVGQTSQTITVPVTGDITPEFDETFAVTLSSPVSSNPPPNTVAIPQSSAIGTIRNDDNTFSIAPLNADQLEGNSGTTPFTFTVSLLTPAVAGTSVNYSVSGGTANAADFGGTLPTNVNVPFTAGQTVQTITVNVSGDTTVEADETFNVTLSSALPAGTQITPGSSQTTGTIRNDDESFGIAAIASSSTVQGSTNFEGASGVTPFTFLVSRTVSGTMNTNETVVLGYAVTGSGANPANATDFGGVLPSGNVVFGPGTLTQTVTVFVTGDTTVEPNETFTVTISNANPAQTNVNIATSPTTQSATAVGTILNDDSSFAIAATNANQLEGNSGTTPFTFTITRTGDTSVAGGVSYSITSFPSPPGSNPGLADPSDFVGTTSGTANFAAGATSQVITEPVNGDTMVEQNEVFTVTLNTPTATGVAGGVNADNNPSASLAAASSANGTIQNDDPGLAITPLNAVQLEGNSGTTPFTFTVSRVGNLNSPTTVNYEVLGGGGVNPAADANDFGGTLPSGQVVFGIGDASKVLTIFVSGDTTVETDEDFEVVLFSPSPSTVGFLPGMQTAVGTIQNDDFARSVAIQATDANKAEGNTDSSPFTPFTFTVTRSGDTTATTQFNWAVTGSGANPADQNDFSGGVLPGGTITFGIGETTKVITVPVNGDTVVEPNETFTVTISNTTNNTGITQATATGTIINDDVVLNPNLAISAANAIQPEGNSGTTLFTFTVTRSVVTSGSGSVNYTVTGNTSPTGFAADANDFTGGILPSGTVNFNPGDTTETISVPVNGDTVFENDEGFTVTLSAASASPVGTTISQATANGTILNDDANNTTQPPTLQQPSDLTETSSGVTTVQLVGADPNSPPLPLTYSASAVNFDFSLQSTYHFSQEGGTYYTNARGQQEKYLISPISFLGRAPQPGHTSSYYYFILPNGNLYEFQDAYSSPALTQSASNLVANIGTGAYNDPTVLTNASSAALGVSTNPSTGVVTLTMPSGVPTGTIFTVTANVNNGFFTTSRTFRDTVSSTTTNLPPTVAQPPDLTVASPGTTSVVIVASDPNSPPLPLSYSASSLNFDASLQSTYHFSEEGGTFYTNARGQQEKYLISPISFLGRAPQAGHTSSYYYFITTNGNLYEFQDAYNSPALTQSASNLVANIGTGGYANPFALINATTAQNVGIGFSPSNQLNLTMPSGVASGTVFVITVNVSDGPNTTSKTFRVTVQ